MLGFRFGSEIDSGSDSDYIFASVFGFRLGASLGFGFGFGAELGEAAREAARYGLRPVHLLIQSHEEVVVVVRALFIAYSFFSRSVSASDSD